MNPVASFHVYYGSTIPKEIYQQCYRNNYRKKGIMQSDLMKVKRDILPGYIIALVNNETSELLSWALLFKGLKEFHDCSMYLWTKKKYRGNALAKTIIKFVEDEINNTLIFNTKIDRIVVEPHDKNSENFFMQLNKDIWCVI